MKYIIQSKCFGDTKWNYRSDVTDPTKAIIECVNAKKQDMRLKMKNNSYRIVDKKEKVLFTLPDDFKP